MPLFLSPENSEKKLYSFRFPVRGRGDMTTLRNCYILKELEELKEWEMMEDTLIDFLKS